MGQKGMDKNPLSERRPKRRSTYTVSMHQPINEISMNIKNRRTRPLPMPSVCDLRSIFVSFVSMGNISSRLFSLGAALLHLLDKAPQP